MFVFFQVLIPSFLQHGLNRLDLDLDLLEHANPMSPNRSRAISGSGSSEYDNIIKKWLNHNPQSLVDP
jgi:hypothetical protein